MKEVRQCSSCGGFCRKSGCERANITPPAPQRPWVGLTDDDIKDIVGRNDSGDLGAYTRKLFKQIEDKLKEKNK